MSLPLASRERGDKIEHRWRMHMHMDGCHWFQSVYVCELCGAKVWAYDERDLAGDPWSLVWMEPTSDEPCARCGELMEGAEPRHEMRMEMA